MVGLPHPQLVGGRRPAGRAGAPAPRPLDRQLQIGDRAVDRVVLAAFRVRVDPADEVLPRRRDPPADDDVLAGQEERAARSGDSSIRAERIAPSPPRRWLAPSNVSIPDGTQGLTREPSLTRAAPASN